MQQRALGLIKKHLPVPECRVHLPPAKYTLVNRGLRGRVGRNIDAVPLTRDDHHVNGGFSVSGDLRVPHAVELDGETADRKRLRRRLPAARNVNQCVFVSRGEFFGCFPVKMVWMQVRKEQTANGCILAFSRDDLPPGLLGRAVKRWELLRQRVKEQCLPAGFQRKAAVADKRDLHPSMSRNSCSERTGMPSSLAFLSLLPAFSPATTQFLLSPRHA